jgi:hypothetical protein
VGETRGPRALMLAKSFPLGLDGAWDDAAVSLGVAVVGGCEAFVSPDD